VVLTVRDAGPGFAAQQLGNIGKPYNSTKPELGRGMGLFLASNVARKLDGALTARNQPRSGAEVTFRLPLAAIALGRD
jgi:two-component system sensor histidine kinase RegB